MKAEEVWVWLQPLESWLASNVTLETDPEEKWHQACIAWAQVKKCYMDCAEGEEPIWASQEVAVDLETKSEPLSDDEASPVVDEVPSVQEDDTGRGEEQELAGAISSGLQPGTTESSRSIVAADAED